MKEKQLYLFNNAICSSYVHVFLLMDHCKMQQTNVHMSESQLQGDEMNGISFDSTCTINWAVASFDQLLSD